MDAGAAVRAISASMRLAVLIGRSGRKREEENYYWREENDNKEVSECRK